MKDTYKAVEVSAPDVLRVVERQVSQPGASQVRIRVEACGICHTDAATVAGTYWDLLRQVWVRFPHTCEVNSRLPTRCSH
jgi:D-arabinose 1-dehydrogenase-like Zn-dependent alcohol dehydrogenase